MSSHPSAVPVRLVLAIAALVLASGCSAHRAAMPAGFAMLPSFPDPGELVLGAGATVAGENAPQLDFRLGGRLSEHFALGYLSTVAMRDGWHRLLPGVLVGLEASILQAPLRLDLSGGFSQSAFFVGARLGVAHEHRWGGGRWALRGAAAGFGAQPLGAGCGEFVSCPQGPTQSSYGAEGSLAVSTRLASIELALGPRVTVVSAGGDPATVIYGLVLQLEGRVRVSDATSPLGAPKGLAPAAPDSPR